MKHINFKTNKSRQILLVKWIMGHQSSLRLTNKELKSWVHYFPSPYVHLLGLFNKSGSAKFGVITDEAPPEICERDGGGVPYCMGIGISFVRGEVVDLEEHRKGPSDHDCPQLEPRGVAGSASPDRPRQELGDGHHHAHCHVPS